MVGLNYWLGILWFNIWISCLQSNKLSRILLLLHCIAICYDRSITFVYLRYYCTCIVLSKLLPFNQENFTYFQLTLTPKINNVMSYQVTTKCFLKYFNHYHDGVSSLLILVTFNLSLGSSLPGFEADFETFGTLQDDVSLKVEVRLFEVGVNSEVS